MDMHEQANATEANAVSPFANVKRQVREGRSGINPRASFRDALLQQLDSDPEKVWLTLVGAEGETQFCNRQLLERVGDYCAFFAAKNVRPGETVLIILRESLDLFASFLAGIVYGALPAYFAYPSPKQTTEDFVKSIENLVRHNRIRLVITYAEVDDVLSRECDAMLGGEGGFLGSVDATSVPTVGSIALPRASTEAFLQFSSGTTGAKKGVRISAASLFRQIDAYLPHVRFDERSRIVSWLPHYHDMGLIACMMIPVLEGVPIVMMSPFEWVRRPAMLLEAVARFRGTHVWLPNFALGHMTKSVPTNSLRNIDLSSLEQIVLCSEPVLKETVAAFSAKFASCGLAGSAMRVCYAMAENTFAMAATGDEPLRYVEVDRDAFQKRGEVELRSGGRAVTSVGRPLANIEIRCVDEQGVALPEGRVGEVQILSDCMLDNYHNNAEATTAALDGEWFKTGDLGFLHDGELYITGRKKDLIIVGGENIYPHDVQLVLNEQAGFIPGRNVVFGVDDERVGTQRIVVLAEVEPDYLSTETTELKTTLLNSLNVSVSTIVLLPPRTLKKSTAGKISNFTNKHAFLAGEYEHLTAAPITAAPITEVSADSRSELSAAAVVDVIRGVLPPDVARSVQGDTRLLTSGIVDSFGFADLVLSLESHFQCSIPQSLWTAAHFDSPQQILRMLSMVCGSDFEKPAERRLDEAAHAEWEASRRKLKSPSTGAASKGGWWEWLINQNPLRASWCYRLLLRAAGVHVGKNVTFLGRIHVKIRGQASNIRIGDGVILGDRVDLRNRENGRIEIGERAYLDQNVRLVAAREGCIELGFGAEIGANTVCNSGGETRIGEFTLIASNVNINASSHGSTSSAFIKSQAHQHGRISIGDDVWIGSGASILMNTTIDDGAIVSSNSLVSGEVPAMAICAGVPAKVIQYRLPASRGA